MHSGAIEVELHKVEAGEFVVFLARFRKGSDPHTIDYSLDNERGHASGVSRSWKEGRKRVDELR